MKINLTAVAVSVSLALSASQTIAADQQVVDVNDLKSMSSSTNKCSGLLCLLKMGTFSSEKYANRYKENLATKTNQPVRVEKDNKNKNLFHVVVGPFNDLAKMLQTGATLTGKPIKAQSQTVKTSPAATQKITKNSIGQTNNESVKTTRTSLNITKPLASVANLFKFDHKKSNMNHYSAKKRTVALSKHMPSSVTRNMPSKHEQILASQADYPVNQKPKVDAKGNVIPIFKTGPYIGASGGIQGNVGKAPATVGYEAFNGTLSAGVGRMFTHRIYMAGEFYLGDNIKARSFPSGISGYAVNSGFNYGGDFIPGFMITDTVLGYLRIGGMRSLFSAIPSSKNTPAPAGFSRRVDVITNGWQVGAGSQTNLYKNLDGRAEYVYTQFQGVAIDKSKGFISQVNIGLVYKFSDALHRA